MSKRMGNGAEPLEKKERKEGADRIKELEEYARNYFEKAVLSHGAQEKGSRKEGD